MDSVYYAGKFVKKDELSISIKNRGLRYGDAFFETIKCNMGRPLFWEDHYFRMAGTFCVLKMEPPPEFEIDRMKSIIQNLLIQNSLHLASARVRITFFRSGEGYYLPKTNNPSFFIETEELFNPKYQLNPKGLNVALYKENYVSSNILSNIKSNNKLVNILASIYAQEHICDDCILLNQDSNIVESISGNVFLVLNNMIITPTLDDGCVDGVMRRILLKNNSLNIKEQKISILNLFNAEEVFFTNVISGIKWVSQIKNHRYENYISNKIVKLLNDQYLI